MAADPAFANVPNVGAKLLVTAETDLQAPAQTQTIITAGANGTKIEEVWVQASKSAALTATTVAGLVYIFLYNGSAYFLYDVITVTAITASSTVAGFRARNVYTNLILPSGWSLRASQSISGNASILNCGAAGADF